MKLCILIEIVGNSQTLTDINFINRWWLYTQFWWYQKAETYPYMEYHLLYLLKDIQYFHTNPKASHHKVCIMVLVNNFIYVFIITIDLKMVWFEQLRWYDRGNDSYHKKSCSSFNKGNENFLTLGCVHVVKRNWNPGSERSFDPLIVTS